MLAITLRDKDGGEHQLSFSQEEVTIGRLDGNDIVLARNNISKLHASVIAAEGKILVVDQKSTNGTYVNGRRITAPQELAPEDKIYIGDFVIQCAAAAAAATEDGGAQGEGAETAPPPMPEGVSAGPTDHVGAEAALANETPASDDVLAEAETLVPDDALETKDAALDDVPSPDATLEATPEQLVDAPPPPTELLDDIEEVQPETLESADPALAETAPEVGLDEVEEATRALSADDMAALDVAEPDGSEVAVESEAEPEVAPGEPLLPPEEEGPGITEEFKAEVDPIDLVADEILAEAAELEVDPVDLVADEIFAEAAEPEVDPVDLVADEIFAEAAEQVEEAPEIDPADLIADEILAAAAEVMPDLEVAPSPQAAAFQVEDDLGLLSSLFADGDVAAVYINGHDSVLVDRGEGPVASESAFSSEDELNELVEHIAQKVGLEGDDARFILSVTLPSGLRVEVVGADFSGTGPLVVAQRPHTVVGGTLEALAKAGLEENAMEELASWVSDGSNIVVAGPSGSGRTATLNALANLIDGSERVALIERGRELSLPHSNQIRLDRDGCVASGSLAEVLESMKVARVVFDDVSGPGLAEFIGLAAVGYRGLLGVMKGTSAEDLLRRLPHELSFFGQGELAAQSREWVADAIDILVIMEHQQIRHILEVGEANESGIETRVLWASER